VLEAKGWFQPHRATRSPSHLSIAAEAALDGIYVVRTNLPAEHSDAAATVRAYKSLSGVEHAFRSLKTVDLELRPVFHWTAPRVRARAWSDAVICPALGSTVWSRMSQKGHEERFPLPMPNGRYRFRKRSLCCQRTGHVGFWVRFLAVKYS
jgi:hypothetical protein